MKPFVSALVGVALALPSASFAQDDLQWTTYTGFDDLLGLDFLTTTFGVPESDGILFVLQCDITGAEPRAEISVSWPTLGVEDGVDIPFFWSTALGSVTAWSQIVVEEEFEGATMAVDLDGLLLRELGNASEITFGINGHQGIPRRTQSLVANQGEALAFPDRCQTLWDQTRGPTTPPPSAPLVADLGPDISGHTWTRFTQVSDDVFETILEINYGVPETDDIAITGQCFIGAQGPYVALQVAADIDGLADGDVATLQVTAADGRSVDISGSVVGQFAEFGVSGVEIVLEMSDPAWLVIAGDRTVRFERMGGNGGLTLTGNGPSTIGPFLADCDQIGDLTPESGERPSAPIGAQDGYLSCDSFGRVASRDTGQPTVMTFFNDSGLYRALLWIDPNGTPVDQGGMNPGETLAFTTDPGHVWMATDGPGNCREMIQPVEGQTEYRLLVE